MLFTTKNSECGKTFLGLGKSVCDVYAPVITKAGGGGNFKTNPPVEQQFLCGSRHLLLFRMIEICQNRTEPPVNRQMGFEVISYFSSWVGFKVVTCFSSKNET